jgi:hypothetical protein
MQADAGLDRQFLRNQPLPESASSKKRPWAVFARIRWQGATEGFFHVQLVRLFEAEGQDRAEWFTGWPAE